MKKSLLVLFLVSAGAIQAGIRDLIILNDRTENFGNEFTNKNMIKYEGETAFGPVSTRLVKALYEKTAPIILTAYTWYNFIGRKKLFNLLVDRNRTLDMISEEFKDYPFLTNKYALSFLRSWCIKIKEGRDITDLKNHSYFPLIGTLAICANIDISDWKMYRSDVSCYLLIPNTYITKINTYKDIPSKEQLRSLKIDHEIESLPFTDTELKLGLKLTDEVPLESLYFFNQHPRIYDPEGGIKSAFITRKDLEQVIPNVKQREIIESYYLHDWYIFLHGHGSTTMTKNISQNTSYLIAGLWNGQFADLLSFWNNQIKTTFLLYDTCYAGGEHLIDPYASLAQVEKGVEQVTFNYTIAASTFNYSITFAKASVLKYVDSNFNMLRWAGESFSDFFQKSHYYFSGEGDISTRLSPKLAKNYIPLIIGELTSIKSGNIAAAIRFPGTQWFSAADTLKHVLRLSRVLIDSYEINNKPIEIDPSKKEYILFSPTIWSKPTEQKMKSPELDSEYSFHEEIMVPITIKTEKYHVGIFPQFLSAAPGNAIYYIKELNTSIYPLLPVLGSFISDASNLYMRSYYISKLNCKASYLSLKLQKELQVEDGQAIELSNVYIINGKNINNARENSIIFILNGKQYKSTWQSNADDNSKVRQSEDLPNLAEVSRTQEIKYPFELPKEPKYKEIAEIPQKHIEQIKAKKEHPSEVQKAK